MPVALLQGPASTVKVGTAVDAVSDDAVGSIKAILYPPVVVRRVLHDVARRTFGVDALHCEEVACPRAKPIKKPRRVQPQASHGGPAPFVTGVTRLFRDKRAYW